MFSCQSRHAPIASDLFLLRIFLFIDFFSLFQRNSSSGLECTFLTCFFSISISRKHPHTQTQNDETRTNVCFSLPLLFKFLRFYVKKNDFQMLRFVSLFLKNITCKIKFSYNCVTILFYVIAKLLSNFLFC